MSIWWDKYKFLIILVVFACFTYLLSDNQTANEEGKVLDDETFAAIQECITRNKIGFNKEIFEEDAEEQRKKMLEMISTGRLPISANNIEIISKAEGVSEKDIINQKSRDADLTIVGFQYEQVKHAGHETFLGYDKIGNVLFVNARSEKTIV